MDRLNGTTVSTTDVCKDWSKIVQSIKINHRPVFVCTNNMPEAVVLSFEEFQKMQQIVEAAHRERLGQKMVCALQALSLLTDQPIPKMVLNEIGVFEKAEGQ